MLYVGASLMIGASIYGFVDYRQNQEKKAFKEMYKEVTHIPARVDPPVVEEKKEIAPVAEAKMVTKKTRTKKARSVKEEEPVIVAIPEEETLTPEPVYITDLTTEIETKPEVTVKKKKKLSSKIFSRAPLREFDLEKTPKVKKEETKNNKS